MTNQDVLGVLTAALPQAVLHHEEFRGDLTITVRKEDIAHVAACVRDHEQLGFDLVVDDMNKIPFFTPLVPWTHGVLLVHHVHGLQWFREFPYPFGVLGWFLESRVIPILYSSWPVIAVSPSTRDDLVELGFDPRRITVVYNGVNMPTSTPKERLAGEHRIAPEVVYFIRPEGYLVTRFINGKHIPPEVITQPEYIRRVARKLRVFHRNCPPLKGEFNVFRRVEMLIGVSEKNNCKFPFDFDWLMQRLWKLHMRTFKNL